MVNPKQAWVTAQTERLQRWNDSPPAPWIFGFAMFASLLFVVMFVVAYDAPIWLGEAVVTLIWLASFGLSFGLMLLVMLHLAGVI